MQYCSKSWLTQLFLYLQVNRGVFFSLKIVVFYKIIIYLLRYIYVKYPHSENPKVEENTNRGIYHVHGLPYSINKGFPTLCKLINEVIAFPMKTQAWFLVNINKVILNIYMVLKRIRVAKTNLKTMSDFMHVWYFL